MALETKTNGSVAEPKTTAAPAPKTAKADKPKASPKKAAPAAAKPEPKTAAPAKKSAEPKPEKAASTDRRSAYAAAATIHVIDLAKCEMKGKRGIAVKTIKDGMSVEEFKTALGKRDMSGYCGWTLTRAIAAKAITVKA